MRTSKQPHILTHVQVGSLTNTHTHGHKDSCSRWCRLQQTQAGPPSTVYAHRCELQHINMASDVSDKPAGRSSRGDSWRLDSHHLQMLHLNNLCSLLKRQHHMQPSRFACGHRLKQGIPKQVMNLFLVPRTGPENIVFTQSAPGQLKASSFCSPGRFGVVSESDVGLRSHAVCTLLLAGPCME